MPTLKLHLPEELLTEENKEDLLTFINKTIPEQDKRFKDFSSYLRGIIRGFAVGSRQTFTQWKSTGRIILPDQTMMVNPDLKLWQGDGVEGLDDGMLGKVYPLTIGGLQYEYLKKAVAWENTYQREVLKSGIEHKNVAELSQTLVLQQLLMLQAQIEEEKLKLEEEALLKEQEK